MWLSSRSGECPYCFGVVPAQVVRLRGSFECPCCGKALKVHGLYVLLMKLMALLIGLLIAREAGCESVLIVLCRTNNLPISGHSSLESIRRPQETDIGSVVACGYYT
jgi:hypothetical protein